MVFSEVRVDGIVDVGLLVLSHCENPAKVEAINFIEKVLTKDIHAVIPVTAFIGAYHIMTRYLKIHPEAAANELIETLSLRIRDVFYDAVSIDSAIEALFSAKEFKVEGWDGYLVSLAKTLGTDTIFTIDKRLTRVKGIKVVIPIPEDVLDKYHKWLEKVIKKQRR
ncbi:MAG: type II toxin-antitoxin system VapC family toxin [Candidatus Korarchaeota archaeon]|nr:type II toxin-antitoxin system VapC family toxin [Candidatus Korarchaeota archaeon]